MYPFVDIFIVIFQNGGIGRIVNTGDVPNVISTEIAACTSFAPQIRSPLVFNSINIRYLKSIFFIGLYLRSSPVVWMSFQQVVLEMRSLQIFQGITFQYLEENF